MLNKVMGTAVILLGAVLAFQFVVRGTFGLLVLAVILALLAANKLIGRWGYAAALLLGVLGIAGALARSIIFSFVLLYKLVPLLIILVGVIVLLKAFGK